jgi:glucose-1-phosphate thymidylyltransferase
VWGIVPAAGAGTRIQPLAFSKELLPVGSRVENGVERPRAVSEYLVERMVRGGATRVCFVVSPGKADILAYYGGSACSAHVSFTVQPQPAGLCDALFRALPMIPPADQVLVGLPDTVWFPADGYRRLPDDALSFLLFPVERPEVFDAVVTDDRGACARSRSSSPAPSTHWVWGGFKLTGAILRELHASGSAATAPTSTSARSSTRGSPRAARRSACGERAPRARRALGREVAAHAARQVAADGQPEPRALGGAREVGAHLHERLEDRSSLSAAMPMPVSRTRTRTRAAARRRASRDPRGRPRRRELDGVREQVEQHLPQLLRVGAHHESGGQSDRVASPLAAPAARPAPRRLGERLGTGTSRAS